MIYTSSKATCIRDFHTVSQLSMQFANMGSVLISWIVEYPCIYIYIYIRQRFDSHHTYHLKGLRYHLGLFAGDRDISKIGKPKTNTNPMNLIARYRRRS